MTAAAADPETALRPPPVPRGRWPYLVVAVALVAAAVGAIVFAGHTNPNGIAGPVDTSALAVGPRAPAVDPVGGWLNSPPLAPADLAGKVVLYDFWTYSCINCVRTIPYLQAWNRRYGPDGLVIVGVEAPEFDFEKVKANVATADTKLGVTWPVALDNDLGIWNAFGTRYWPTKDIADRQGRLRYQDFGEGRYAQTEDVIRTLLAEPPAAPRAAAPSAASASANGSGGGDLTGETYLGTAQGAEGARSGSNTYPVPGPVDPDTARLGGTWVGEPQEVTAGTAGSVIVLDYHARQVNLTLAPPADGAAADLGVQLDGRPLPPAYRTADTMVAADGTTFVHVSADDEYRLVLGPATERHTLTLTALAPGVEAFDFTFGA